MSLPILSIFFEAEGSTTFLGRWEARSIKSGLAEPHQLPLQRSFGVLTLVIEGARPEVAHLVVDGRPGTLNQLGGALVSRVTLSNDIETHRFAFVQVPDVASTIDIAVVHQQRVVLGGVYQAFCKWTQEDYEREFSRFKSVLAKQRQTIPDVAARSVAFGTSSELNSAIVQVVGNLSHLVATLRMYELLYDFAELSPGGIDREGILSYLKQDPRRLVKSPAGPIALAGERFTTGVNIRTLSRSARCDLSSIATLLDDCAAWLQASSAPAVAAMMLCYSAEDLRSRFSSRRRAAPAEVDSLLNRRMHSAVGSELQSQLRLIVACSRERAIRDSKADQGLLWLQQSIRDFDVFQAASFLLVARAFGFSESDALSSTGVLSTNGLTILNGNRSGALERFFEGTPGWRQGSAQPSEYRPDIVVMVGETPVILDAKFAVSLSEELPLPAAPMKAVQAYLDEFDQPGAILIVPKVLNPALLDADGTVKVTGTTRGGRKRLLIGVPLQDPCSPASQLALANAVRAVAALHQ